jgi:hypothetical protein
MQGTQLSILVIQDWLLDQNKCIHCGRNLLRLKKERKNGFELIKCKCERVYVWEYKINVMRPAQVEDIHFFKS